MGDTISNRINSGQTIVIAAFLSLIIAKDKTDEDLNFLGNILVCIGTNLLAITSANALNESLSQTESQMESDDKT